MRNCIVSQPWWQEERMVVHRTKPRIKWPQLTAEAPLNWVLFWGSLPIPPRKSYSVFWGKRRKGSRETKITARTGKMKGVFVHECPLLQDDQKNMFCWVIPYHSKNFLGVTWYYNSRFIPGMFMRMAVSAQHKEKWIFRRMPNDEGIFGCCLCCSCQLQNNYVFISPCVCFIHMQI